MRVRDLMNYPLLTIRRDSFVNEAMRLMDSEKKGCILICDEGLFKKIEGILTRKMILNNVYAAGKDPGEIRVLEIMKRAPLVTVDMEMNIDEAAKTMIDNDIRRLIVVKAGVPVGIISSKDIIMYAI